MRSHYLDLVPLPYIFYRLEQQMKQYRKAMVFTMFQ